MKVAGVDEAGRGCVIGPLVIAGVLFDAETLPTLKELGVRDSKKLTVKKRTSLEEEIRKLAVSIETFELKPSVIDKVVFRGQYLRRLNYLETMVMARIIRKLKPDVAYVDSPDVVSERCMSQIKSVIDFDLNIVCEHKADDTYLSTGAASIIAKVIRDERVAKLRDIHGDFNSGYAHDQKTQDFIADYFSKHKECPDFIRGSWVTVQRHLSPFKQAKLEPLHDLSQKDQE